MNTGSEEVVLTQQSSEKVLPRSEKQNLLVSISEVLGVVAQHDTSTIERPEAASVDATTMDVATRLVSDLFSEFTSQELAHEFQDIPIKDDKILAFRKVCVRLYHKKRNKAFDSRDEDVILLGDIVKKLDTYAMFRAVLSPKTLNRMFEELDQLKKKRSFFLEDVQLAAELLNILEIWMGAAKGQESRILQDNIHVLSQLKIFVEMKVRDGAIENHFEVEKNKIVKEWNQLKLQSVSLLQSGTITQLENFEKNVSSLIGFKALQDRLSSYTVIKDWLNQMRVFHTSLNHEANPILGQISSRIDDLSHTAKISAD